MATPSAGIQVEGAAQLRRSLKRAAGDVSQLKTAHAEAGTFVASAARPSTPNRTGRLSRSVRSSATNTAATIRAGNNTTTPYAGPIHWGWARRHISPQPWVTETAQRTEPTWTRIYEKAVNSVLATIKGATP